MILEFSTLHIYLKINLLLYKYLSLNIIKIFETGTGRGGRTEQDDNFRIREVHDEFQTPAVEAERGRVSDSREMGLAVAIEREAVEAREFGRAGIGRRAPEDGGSGQD